MAADLKSRYKVKADLIPSGGGVVEVCVESDLICSKKALGRFPEHSEIFEEIDALNA